MGAEMKKKLLGKITEITLIFTRRQHHIFLVSTTQVEHSNSLLFFGNAPNLPPWIMDWNMDLVSFFAVAVSASLLLLYFPFDAACWNSPMKYWHTFDSTFLMRADDDQTWGHSGAHWWMFPDGKLIAEVSFCLYFPWIKAVKINISP